MSRIISNLLMTIAMFPAAVALVVFSAILLEEMDFDEEVGIPLVCVITVAFVYLYWTGVWRSTVQWTGNRRIWTLLSALVSLGAGALVGVVMANVIPYIEPGFICGSFVAAVAWMISSAFVWRETDAERAERVNTGSSGGGGYIGPLLCPRCGYNMRGLTHARCPECGTEYTLDALLTANVERALPERELATGD